MSNNKKKSDIIMTFVCLALIGILSFGVYVAIRPAFKTSAESVSENGDPNGGSGSSGEGTAASTEDKTEKTDASTEAKTEKASATEATSDSSTEEASSSTEATETTTEATEAPTEATESTTEPTEKPTENPTEKPTEHKHTWTKQISTIHHDAVTEEKPAWDEEIEVDHTICTGCGADLTGTDVDAHLATCRQTNPDASTTTNKQTETIHHDAETVVVKKAYDERI